MTCQLLPPAAARVLALCRLREAIHAGNYPSVSGVRWRESEEARPVSPLLLRRVLRKYCLGGQEDGARSLCLRVRIPLSFTNLSVDESSHVLPYPGG